VTMGAARSPCDATAQRKENGFRTFDFSTLGAANYPCLFASFPGFQTVYRWLWTGQEATDVPPHIPGWFYCHNATDGNVWKPQRSKNTQVKHVLDPLYIISTSFVIFDVLSPQRIGVCVFFLLHSCHWRTALCLCLGCSPANRNR